MKFLTSLFRKSQAMVLSTLSLVVAGALLLSGCEQPSASADLDTTTVSSEELAAESSTESSAETAPKKVVAPQRVLDITFDDLKFEIEKDGIYEEGLLTDKIRGFIGKKIRIRGYMYPTLRQNGIDKFVFVRDNMACCFGPGAALYDCMQVEMEEGKTTSYSLQPITVEGEFSLDEYKDYDDVTRAIFYLRCREVK